jgi:DNA-binding response OmpR family regulator
MEKLKNSTILYIEDDDITRGNISSFLQRKCENFYSAVDGKEGLEFFEKYQPDIIITDIEMPNLDGLSMAKKIRKQSASTQIIITTAYTSQEYLLEAVNLQLIKYIVKPISLPKLNEALTSCEDFLEEDISTKKYLETDTFYDIYTKELIKDNQIISLSKNERTLIDLLIKNHPAPTSYEAIETNVYEFASSKNAIKLLVKSLRNKINKEAISNVSGLGYNINIEKE